MNHSVDVTVVGGGVIGCSIAYHLAQQGAKVMVVEKRTVGGQASSVAAGMLAAQEETESPGPFFDVCRASRDLFPALVPEVAAVSGIDPEWEVCGITRAAATEEELVFLRRRREWQEALGLPVEWLTPSDVAEQNPGLSPVLGALRFPADGQINSARWAQALAEGARRRGARFMDQVPTVEWLRSGRRLTGLVARGEKVDTEHVVLAAGCWTSFLLESLGLSLPLEPVKGQLMVLHGKRRLFRGPLYARPGYVVPKPDGRIIIGATMERAGFNVRPTLEAQRTLADWASQWCPELTTLPAVEFQVGLRPGTVDGWPVMGRLWDYDNLFVAAGHFRNGILLSPFAGRYMADGIVQGRWDPLGDPFSPERFRRQAAPAS